MTKALRGRFISAVLAAVMLSGTAAVPGAADSAPQSVGSVVLSETFDAGTFGGNVAGWNGWELFSTAGDTYKKDTDITITNGQKEEILKSSATKMPLQQFAEIKRTTSNSTSAMYLAQKAVTVPAGNSMINIRFRAMAGSNANIFMLRLTNDAEKAFDINVNFYLKRPQNFLCQGLTTGNLESTQVAYNKALYWYDIDFLLDYTKGGAYLYVDGAPVGFSEFSESFKTNFPKPENLAAVSFGSARDGALTPNATGEGCFYLDDLTITAIPESGRNDFIAQRLRRYVPGGVSSGNTLEGKAETTTLAQKLPSELYGMPVSWSCASDLVSISNGQVTVTHPKTGGDVPVQLTAAVGGASYDYPLNIAAYGVWLTENFEGSFAEKNGAGIAGWNGWENNWALNATQPDFSTTEEVVCEDDGNHAGRFYRIKDSSDSPSYYLQKPFGRTLSSGVATSGLSIRLRVKTGRDVTSQLNVGLESTNTLFTIDMNRGIISVPGKIWTFAAPDAVIPADVKYPIGGAVAGKWYDIEFYSELKQGGKEKLYVDGELIGETVRTGNAGLAGSRLIVLPVRKSMGSGGEYLIDDICVKQLTPDELALQNAADAVTLFDETHYGKIELPETAGEGISVTWESNDPAILADDGTILTKYPEFATITGTFSKNGMSTDRTYRVSIGADCAVDVTSVSAVTKTATCNVNSARLTGPSKLIVGAYKDGRLLGAGVYNVDNRVATYQADLSKWWTDVIPSDAEIKAFVLDAATLQPQSPAASRAANAKAMWLCGDSTMDSYDIKAGAKDPGEPEERRLTGWGEYLDEYFDPSRLVIENYAVSGRRARIFYQNEWKSIVPNLKSGDYVMIQFAHNDQKDENDLYKDEPNPKEASLASYVQYLTYMVNEAREKGAIPVFATSINRRNFVNGVFTQNLGGYPERMMELAEELDIPVVNLYAKTAEWLEAEGEADTLKYYRQLMTAADNTHMTPMGARKICDMAAALIRENSELTELASYLK